MPPTTVHSAPPLDSFTTLADHQSHTPASFYAAKPILHYHAVAVRALAAQDQVFKLPIFTQRSEGGAQPLSGGEDGDGEGSDVNMIVELVDAFINSENLTLFNNTSSVGLSIPYPAISLHAIQRLTDPTDPTKQVQGLYMQLDLTDPHSMGNDEEQDTIELTLIPSQSTNTDTASTVQAIFEAVSNCSNLHPDPAYEEDVDMGEGVGDSRIVFEGSVGYEGISGLPGVQRGADDGGLPPPFPGSGGWITAENVSEYFDEEGNWIGENGETLGEGAGRVRGRDEVDGDGVNGHGEDNDDSKRPRTD